MTLSEADTTLQTHRHTFPTSIVSPNKAQSDRLLGPDFRAAELQIRVLLRNHRPGNEHWRTLQFGACGAQQELNFCIEFSKAASIQTRVLGLAVELDDNIYPFPTPPFMHLQSYHRVEELTIRDK